MGLTLRLRAEFPTQHALTVVAPIHPETLEELRKELRDLDERVRPYRPPGANPSDASNPFHAVTSLHFARFVVLPAADPPVPGGEAFPATLVFASHHDLPRAEHLEQLIHAAGAELARIYEHCVGFDAEAGPLEVRLRRYLERHARPHGAFFIGAWGRTVEQIGYEQRLTQEIRSHLDQYPRPAGEGLVALRARIRTHVNTLGRRPVPPPDRRRVARRYRLERVLLVAAALLGVLAVALLPPIQLVFLGGLIVVLALVRAQEERDSEVQAAQEAASSALRREQEAAHGARLAQREDLGEQNELTTVVAVKASRLRRGILRGVLWVGERATRYYWNWTRGKLLGISSIHFAHWVMLDGGRRLLFVSNYDGSWSGYLDDFVLHGARWLSAIWGQCVGFPRTRYLVFDGAADAPRFKRWARGTQFAADVWYSAYPELSLEEINANSEMVRDLWSDTLSAREIEAWLAKI